LLLHYKSKNPELEEKAQLLLEIVLLCGGDYVKFLSWSNLFNGFAGKRSNFVRILKKKCEFLTGRALLLL